MNYLDQLNISERWSHDFFHNREKSDISEFLVQVRRGIKKRNTQNLAISIVP